LAEAAAAGRALDESRSADGDEQTVADLQARLQAIHVDHAHKSSERELHLRKEESLHQSGAAGDESNALDPCTVSRNPSGNVVVPCYSKCC